MKARTLSVSQKLKSVLCTKLMLSNEDTEEICNEWQGNQRARSRKHGIKQVSFFMILLCALFRMAHCIMFPPRRIVVPIFRTLNGIEQNIIHSVWICYKATEQFITSFLPLATVYLLLIISSHLWCFAFRLLHWTKCYYIFVSHGRPLQEIFKDPDRESNKHPYMGIPIREIIRHEHELKHQSKCCKKKLKDLDISSRSKWDDLQTNLIKRTIHIWKTSLLIFGGFPALDCVSMPTRYLPVPFCTILDRLLRAGLDSCVCLS